jgi:hypothetical protein
MYKQKIIILILIIAYLLSVSCTAADVTEINMLAENAAALDKTEITIQGELIGEALERGEYAWININDTTNAIGVWVKLSDIDQVQFYGDYKHKGDVVRITGIFNRACPEHGGDVDIHCVNIKIVKKGYPVTENVSLNKIISAAVLIITAIIITAFNFRKVFVKKLQWYKKIKDAVQ